MKYLIVFLLFCSTAFGQEWTGLISSELALATLKTQDEQVPRSECTVCDGTGKVKAGDGRTIVWRDCDNCYDDTGAEQEKRCVLFFTADWCRPCVRVKRQEFPPMRENGWRIVDYEDFEAGCHIGVVESDLHRELVDQFDIRLLPTFVVVDSATRSHEFDRHVGYLDQRGIRDLWGDEDQSGDG